MSRRRAAAARLRREGVGRRRQARRCRLPHTRRRGRGTVRHEERERLPDALRHHRRRSQGRLQATVVPRAVADQAQPVDRVRPCARARGADGRRAHRDRRLCAHAEAVREGTAEAGRDGGRRLAVDPDADRAVLREPASHPGGHERPVRPGRDRCVGVLERAHRLGAGRADRDSRDQRAVVDRPRRLERVHPPSQPHAHSPLSRSGCRDAGDNPPVIRVLTVVLLLASAAGAAAWRLSDTKPDPNVQAIADGCQRDTTKIYTGFAPNWVYVNDKDVPSSDLPPGPRWATGTVKGASRLLASRVASSDDPITHSSYDVNIDVTVDRADDFLTGVSRDTTPEAGEIHLERESGAFPLWAWPRPGDRIQALGSWVWDCDHYQGRGEKTELHPFRGVFVTRTGAPRGSVEGDLYFTTDATPAGKEAECAHKTKGSESFKSCSHGAANTLNIDGTYSFRLCGPPGGVTTIADMGSVAAPKVTVARTKTGCATASFAIDAHGRRVVLAKRILLGAPKRLTHLRLRFDRLLVRRAMDPSCAPDKPDCPYASQSTLRGQIASAPGEWQLYWSVNGIWGRWPGTLAAKDGSTFAGRQHVDFWVDSRKPWTFVALARECDFGALPGWDGPGHPTAPCPQSDEVGNSAGDDYPGAITVTQRGLGLGRHVMNASTEGSTCPVSNARGCYQLTYTVSRVR